MFATVFRSAFSKRASEGVGFEELFVSSSEESSIMRRRGIVSLFRGVACCVSGCRVDAYRGTSMAIHEVVVHTSSSLLQFYNNVGVSHVLSKRL